MIRPWIFACALGALFAGSVAAAAAPPLADRQNSCPGKGSATQRLEAARAWQASGGKDKAEYCVAVALFDAERWPDAAQAFATLADRQGYPSALRAKLKSAAAQSWLLAGDDSKAIDLLSSALALQSRNAALWVDRARAFADGNAWTEALADLDKAVELDPNLAEARVFRASARRHLGDANAAADDLAAAIHLDPSDPEAYLERGLLRLSTGDESGATDDWRKVTILAPETETSRLAWKNLEALHDSPRR